MGIRPPLCLMGRTGGLVRANPVCRRRDRTLSLRLLALERLEAAEQGIIPLHDTKAVTAAMLPAFLHALKIRGYRIVHTVPAAPAH
jgi:hypothetical protein